MDTRREEAMKDHVLYDDGVLRLDEEGLTLRRYYFPIAASKRIPYSRSRGIREWRLGLLTGRWRLWGSGDFRHWAPFDPHRSHKTRTLELNVGGWVRPVVSPEDPERVLAILHERVRSL
jgi:hypothetical protein